jgi:hypothetical protein
MEWVSSTLHTTSERGVSSITTADAHTSATSSRLNWRPHRFKWTRPFRQKMKSGFYTCAITFQTQSTYNPLPVSPTLDSASTVSVSTWLRPHKEWQDSCWFQNVFGYHKIGELSRYNLWLISENKIRQDIRCDFLDSGSVNHKTTPIKWQRKKDECLKRTSKQRPTFVGRPQECSLISRILGENALKRTQIRDVGTVLEYLKFDYLNWRRFNVTSWVPFPRLIWFSVGFPINRPRTAIHLYQNTKSCLQLSICNIS